MTEDQIKRKLEALDSMFGVYVSVHPPPRQYGELQAHLQRLRERPHGESDGSTTEVYSKLRDCFIKAFDLHTAYYRQGWEQALRDMLGKYSGFYDHHDHLCYGYGSARTDVIVCQPYGYYTAQDVEPIAKIAACWFGELVDLNAWAYYYPGYNHAGCWALVLSQVSKKMIIDRTMRHGDFSAKFIFTEMPERAWGRFELRV